MTAVRREFDSFCGPAYSARAFPPLLRGFPSMSAENGPQGVAFGLGVLASKDYLVMKDMGMRQALHRLAWSIAGVCAFGSVGQAQSSVTPKRHPTLDEHFLASIGARPKYIRFNQVPAASRAALSRSARNRALVSGPGNGFDHSEDHPQLERELRYQRYNATTTHDGRPSSRQGCGQDGRPRHHCGVVLLRATGSTGTTATSSSTSPATSRSIPEVTELLQGAIWL